MATQTKKAGSRIWEKMALLLRLAQWKRLTSSPWNWRSFSQEPSSLKLPCPARDASSRSASGSAGRGDAMDARRGRVPASVSLSFSSQMPFHPQAVAHPGFLP